MQKPRWNAFYDFKGKKLTAEILDTIEILYATYNAFLHDNGYEPKYNLGDAHMFVIDGMEKVRCVIEENRKRKLTRHKKISNNTVIEIDNCSPLEMVKLQKNLLRIAGGEGIEFVYSKGKNINRKSRSFMRSWRNAAGA